MPGVLRPVMRWLSARPARPRAEGAAQPAPAQSAPPVTRRLAQALDRAVRNRQWEHAERLAAAAVRCAPMPPGLVERMARLRLAQDRAEEALHLIDGCASPTASLRLLRATCLLVLGRREESHLDLLAWSRRTAAPLDARRMLALLEWEAGDTDAAFAALRRNLRHLEDTQTIELLLVLNVLAERREPAAQCADRLTAAAAREADTLDTRLLLESLGLPAPQEEVAPEAAIETLTAEIIADEPSLAFIAEAQRVAPEPAEARLVALAAERAFDELADPAAACEALAKLHLALEEPVAAARWLERGLERNPMSASLALLKQSLAAPAAPAAPADAPATRPAEVKAA